MKENNKMFLNTGVMYLRIIITMVITLLSSRWILLSLGTEDFGIFSLVAGMLSMLMFLNLSMSTATQRFLSFYLGKGVFLELKEAFYISCILHFIIGVFVLLLIEVLGVFFLQSLLNIPINKIPLAIFVLHCLSISTFFSVISVPYNACLISHENILFVSLVSITEAILKLMTSIFLLYYDGEHLKLYAVCMMIIPIISIISYRFYCNKHYKECHIEIRKINNIYLCKEMTLYAIWNMIGSLSSLLRTQGVSMLLNLFYGVSINAAYGIASQVNGQLNYFSTAIVTATKPQIVKSEGQGNRRRMLELSEMTCKISFLLLSIITIPMIIKMPYILSLWLKNVPLYSDSFCVLLLFLTLIFQMSIGISIGIESVGKIKQLQLIVGSMHFLVLPIGYIILKSGCSPESVFYLIIIEECIGIIIKLFISHNITGLSIYNFAKRVILPCFITFCITFLLCSLVSFEDSLFDVFLMLLISCASICICLHYFVLTDKEKSKIYPIISNTYKKMCYWGKNLYRR